MNGYNLDSDRPHLQVFLGKVYTLAQLAVAVGQAVYSSFDVGCYSMTVARHPISLITDSQLSKRASRQWTADHLYLELLNPRADDWEAVLTALDSTGYRAPTHLTTLQHRGAMLCKYIAVWL